MGYYLETNTLMQSGMPAPVHFTREDWRLLHRVKVAYETITAEALPAPQEDE